MWNLIRSRRQSVFGPVMRGAWPRGLIACPATAAAILLLCAAPCLAQAPEDIVTAQRAHYGERISPAEAPILLRAIAAELTQTFGTRYGLLVKTSGNNCGSFACDVICDANRDHFDVFGDGPDASANYSGQAVPQWLPKGPIGDRTCALVDAAPAPDPLPPPSPVDLTPLLHRLDQLEAALLELNARERADVAQLAETIADRAETLTRAITELAHRPTVTSCQASAFGIPLHCEVK